MPVTVAEFVGGEESTWSDLIHYAQAILLRKPTKIPMSTVGRFLRENGGASCWADKPA